jgi:hypothetical protein
MTKVISTKSISFPKLGWGITEGVETELPAEKEAQERILMETEITIVGSKINKNNKSEEDSK